MRSEHEHLPFLDEGGVSGESGTVGRLGAHAARTAGRVAAEPEDHRRRHPAVAPPDVPLVGPRADPGLQRRLPAQLRRGQAPGRHGSARPGLLAGDLADHLAPDRRRDEPQALELERGPTGAGVPQRAPRGGLLDVRLLSRSRRPGWCRRRAGGRAPRRPPRWSSPGGLERCARSPSGPRSPPIPP